MTNPNYNGPPYNYPPGTEVTMAEAATLTLYKLKILQELMNDLRSSSQANNSATQADISATRELVQHLSEDIKRIEANQISHIVTRQVTYICENQMPKYAVGGVLLLAIGYRYMSVKGISVSNILKRTKSSMASYYSSMKTHLGNKSAALAESLRHLIFRKPAIHKEARAVPISQIATTGQEYSDMLLTLVIREAAEFDEDFLGEVFDYLNENHVAARGFISKPPNMRKKWLRQFSKKTTEETEGSH